MSEQSADFDAHWIDAPREVCDRINVAVRDLGDALDAVTAEPTWRHLIDQLKATRDAADHAVSVAALLAVGGVTPPEVGRS